MFSLQNVTSIWNYRHANWIDTIISQCICLSKHNLMLHNYKNIICQLQIEVKLKKKKRSNTCLMDLNTYHQQALPYALLFKWPHQSFIHLEKNSAKMAQEPNLTCHQFLYSCKLRTTLHFLMVVKSGKNKTLWPENPLKFKFYCPKVLLIHNHIIFCMNDFILEWAAATETCVHKV